MRSWLWTCFGLSAIMLAAATADNSTGAAGELEPVRHLQTSASSYVGLWTGPGHDGSNEYPVVEMVVVIIGTILFVVIVGGVAMWQSKAISNGVESGFEAVGRLVGKAPCTTCSITVFVLILLSAGQFLQENEVDAARLWVPAGAVGLAHKDYVTDNWPSTAMPTFIMVIPENGDIGPNILTPEKIVTLWEKHLELMNIVVDGDKVVDKNKDVDDYNAVYGGAWSFEGKEGTKQKCFKFNQFDCGQNSILSLFGYNDTAVRALTQQSLLARVALWDSTPKDTFLPGVFPPVYKNFELGDVLGGIERDAGGNIVSCKVFSWSLFTRLDERPVLEGGEETLADPVAVAWEADAVCLLGVQDEHPTEEGKTCPSTKGLMYKGFFQRSFADEFGNAIQGDIGNVIIAYYLIIIYLFFNLGKRDTVHSMFAMSGVCLLCVTLSFVSGMGIGGFFGIKKNPLLNNIPFLLLGLGVDDAFVLSSEFLRHMRDNPEASAAELCAKTARTGGLSVLVTSLTDALAFLVGGSTKLPALSAFCLYAGICVLFCFVLQITLFLPLLAVNHWRVKANRFDCFCCCTSSIEHPLDQPQGTCCCVGPLNPPDSLLQKSLKFAGEKVVKTLPGRIITIFVWLVVFAFGVGGLVNVKKNFQLEWFFPDDSYVNEFITISEKYFAQGETFNFYTTSIDMYARQDQMNELTAYIGDLDFVQQTTVQNWWYHFSNGTPVQYTDKAVFWNDVWMWYKGPGEGYRRNVQWVDADCTAMDDANCDPSAGFKNTRIAATLNRLKDGGIRYRALHKMREDVNEIFEDSSGKLVFPYTLEFLFWEEFGIIDQELVRNLIVAAGIIFAIVCLLIPRPSIAILVSVLICMSIGEVVGFMHYWDVTINGPSTIYLLICVGLAVDYSAHIAHVFKHQQDEEPDASREDLSVQALARIGPSVFQALLSTILALVVLGFSKSYIFRIFFKVLFSVTMIAGLKGMWLLPVLLAIPLPGTAKSSPTSKCKVVEVDA